MEVSKGTHQTEHQTYQNTLEADNLFLSTQPYASPFLRSDVAGQSLRTYSQRLNPVMHMPFDPPHVPHFTPATQILLQRSASQIVEKISDT